MTPTPTSGAVGEPRASVPHSPALFISAGQLAERALDQLPQAAQRLRLRLSGPFGVLRIRGINPAGNGSTECDARTLSEIPSRSALAPPVASRNPRQQVRNLVRTILARRATVSFRERPKRPLPVYVVVDLVDNPDVTAVLDALRVLLEEELHCDVTALLLTGRSAAFDETEGRWVRELIRFKVKVQRSGLVHRGYLLDGKSNRQEWLQTADDHARMAAEFLVHHGFTPFKDVLRKHEAGRLLLRQPVEDFLGAFSCRTLHSDRAAVSRGLAEALEPSLFDSSQIPVVGERQRDQIVELAAQAGSELRAVLASGAIPANSPHDPLRLKLHESLVETYRVAGVAGLDIFYEAFAESPRQLRLLRRVDDRRKGRKQAADWLARLLVDPVLPTVDLPEPPARSDWVVAILLCVASGVSLGLHSYLTALRPWPLLGAVACALALLCYWMRPAAWQTFKRSPSNETDDAPIPSRTYLARTPPAAAAWGTVAALGGAWLLLDSTARLAGPLASWQWLVPLGTAVSAAGGLAIVQWLRGPEVTSAFAREHDVDPEDVASPLTPWGFNVLLMLAGLVISACAWILATWPIAWQSGQSTTSLGMVGLLLVLTGVWVFARPRAARDRFLCDLPTGLSPTHPLRSPAFVTSAVDDLLMNLQHWCSAMMETVPGEAAGDVLQVPGAQPVGCILEAIALDWQEQLAAQCRQDLGPDPINPIGAADALLGALDRPDGVGLGIRQILSQQLAERWLSQHSWRDLVFRLGGPGHPGLVRFFRQTVAPLWNPPHDWDYDLDSCIVAFDPDLESLLGHRDQSSSACQFVPTPWPVPGTLVLVRIVQGGLIRDR